MTIIIETYPTIPIKDIIRDGRHRKDFGDIISFADNIKEVGLLHPVTLDQHNRLIDGERRILAYHELDKTEIPYFRINLEETVLGEFSANIFRKDWTIEEIVAIKRALEPYEKKKAKERQLSGKKPSGNFPKGRVLDNIAKMLGKDRKTLSKMEYIVNRKQENPAKYQELVDKIDSNSSSVEKVFKIMDKDEKRIELLKSESSKLEIPKNCKLLLGDFTIIQKEIPDNSVDLILTDPPYSIEYLSLYEELAKLAVRVLKPGGSLVTYVGHIIMDEVINIFTDYSLVNDTGLKYWWIFAVKHSGNHTKIHQRNVFQNGNQCYGM